MPHVEESEPDQRDFYDRPGGGTLLPPGQQRTAVSSQPVTYDDGLPRYDPLADPERGGSQVVDQSARGIGYGGRFGADAVRALGVDVVGASYDDDLSTKPGWMKGPKDDTEPLTQPGHNVVK